MKETAASFLRSLRRLAAIGALAVAGRGAHAEPLRIVLFSGATEYESTKSLTKLKQHLEAKAGVNCALHETQDKGTGLPGIEQLENCDVAIIFTRRITLSANELARFQRFAGSTKGVVGIRTASHAFQNWLAIDEVVWGGSYAGHYEDRPAKITLEAPAHPVLAGVMPFVTPGKLYKNPKLAADATLLVRAATDQATEPVAWTRERPDGGRAFYTSLGVPADFDSPSFLRLLTNAIFWSAHRTPPPSP